MFITARCKVNAANNTLPVLKEVSTKYTPNFYSWRRAVQKLYDFVTSNSSQCDATQVHLLERNGSPTKI